MGRMAEHGPKRTAHVRHETQKLLNRRHRRGRHIANQMVVGWVERLVVLVVTNTRVVVYQGDWELLQRPESAVVVVYVSVEVVETQIVRHAMPRARGSPE